MISVVSIKSNAFVNTINDNYDGACNVCDGSIPADLMNAEWNAQLLQIALYHSTSKLIMISNRVARFHNSARNNFTKSVILGTKANEYIELNIFARRPSIRIHFSYFTHLLFRRFACIEISLSVLMYSNQSHFRTRFLTDAATIHSISLCRSVNVK